jgi:hypothetical protein
MCLHRLSYKCFWDFWPLWMVQSANLRFFHQNVRIMSICLKIKKPRYILGAPRTCSWAVRQKWILKFDWRHFESSDTPCTLSVHRIDLKQKSSKWNADRASSWRAWNLSCKSHTPSINSPAANQGVDFSLTHWGYRINWGTQNPRRLRVLKTSFADMDIPQDSTPRAFHLLLSLDRRSFHNGIQTPEFDDPCH